MPEIPPGLKRRRLLLSMVSALGVAAAASAAQRLLPPTPRQSAGPFYPQRPPLDDDNDLVHVQGHGAAARGRVTDLSGRVLDINGRPVGRARVEIWQCDANGRYHHPRDVGGALDQNFQGFGHTVTDAQGRYRFLTIRPVPYPGRTPHIHMAVFPPGAEPLVTQIYVRGEPRNADDFLFKRVPAALRHRVQADFVATARAEAELEAMIDIVVAGAQGTPGA